MGRRKSNKPRRPRPDRSMAEKAADAYRCGHCHSAVGWSVDEDGTGHINIHHDSGCPVLAATLSDVPDMLRAADMTGGTVITDASTGRAIGLIHLGSDEGGTS